MRKPHTYWDEGVTLVSSCTPCSPGCERCWAIAIERRFKPEFKGQVQFHPERLTRFKKKKPTVFSIWNDLFHESITMDFHHQVYETLFISTQHTFLILTKRPQNLLDYYYWIPPFDNVWHGLTVCNQEEADEKIPIFLQVPGKKFLSIEPMLGETYLTRISSGPGFSDWHYPLENINAVILGCETGAKARPMNLDWVYSIVDQCKKTRGVPLFIKALTINGKPNHNIEDWPAELRIRQLAW